jgi:hypothetical protein
MPNKYYANQTAPQSSQPSSGSHGSIKNVKDSGFPGVPGKTQPRDRSNGIPKTGKLGPFRVKSEGL